MADNTLTGGTPAETKGINVNYRPSGDHWVLEMTPNPSTTAEAFRPKWRALFRVDGMPANRVFTHAQMVSALSMSLEEIAKEAIDASEFWGSL